MSRITAEITSEVVRNPSESLGNSWWINGQKSTTQSSRNFNKKSSKILQNPWKWPKKNSFKILKNPLKFTRTSKSLKLNSNCCLYVKCLQIILNRLDPNSIENLIFEVLGWLISPGVFRSYSVSGPHENIRLETKSCRISPRELMVKYDRT